VVDPVRPAGAKEHFDVDHDFIAHLNGECIEWAGLNDEALQSALRAQGESWCALVKERCQHLFAAAPVFVSELQLQQMRSVIAAVGEAVGVPGPNTALGAFYGYDFHLNAQGAHLIEINTNAGGGFLNGLLIDSQQGMNLYGSGVSDDHLEKVFVEMLRNEWRRERADMPLKTIAIMDEDPESQYLYPEFLLAQKAFKHDGLEALILDPSALEKRDEGLYFSGQRIDLIYNRLTDFDLSRYQHIRSVWENRQVVLTPNPGHYQRYADKRKLETLSDEKQLRSLGISPSAISALLQCVPETKQVRAEDAEQWWGERKQWFFKPLNGHGGKGAYRGDKLTKRVFEEIMHADYVAQRLAVPSERKVCLDGSEPQSLKFDVRCYVYDGHIQLVAARLYQGQTTNFRTPGGGFALVRVVE
jgi:hypothetical protein